MDPVRKAYIQLHIAVLLFGLTAILGDLISLPALQIVWWRVFITSLSLLFIIRIPRMLREIPRTTLWKYIGIGVLLAIHWVTFYGAIKLANASVALVCMATTSFFTAILEPIILRRPFAKYELALGLFIIPGMVLITNGLGSDMMAGVWVGLLSALLISIVAIFNKKLINNARPFDITFLEIGSAWMFLTICLPVYFIFVPAAPFWPSSLDWIYLLILALLCTTLAYFLSLLALKHLSAFASNLTVNLEPVYGILLAIIILKEHHELKPVFFAGVGIILLAVFSYPVLKKRFG